ncbi:hypothetical protein QUF75_12980 [Desulfococcaceae bacterium HSG7]|nr:hypothetical protein [Desulfococcaceae bacterium HSG7]
MSAGNLTKSVSIAILSMTMKTNPKKHKKQDLKYQLSGWILFILCAVFFLASSIKNQDTLTFIGSVIFLIACIVFLIPLLRTIKKSECDATIHDDKKNHKPS